jgi:hypothetical protein
MWDVHAYDTNGQTDPSQDSGSTQYTRCASGNLYLDDDTTWRATGNVWLTLGGSVIDDVAAAKAAVNRFSLGVHEEGDNDASPVADGSSILPQLEITYTTAVTMVTVEDSIGLSDAALCHKTFAVGDSVGLTETLVGLPSASKIVADAVSLADVVSVYIIAVLKIVEDNIGLSDAVYRNKALIISDAVSLVEQVLRHKPLLPVSDVLTLAEIVSVSKLLSVADSVSLSDVAKVLKQLRVSDSITLVDAAQIPSKILKVLDSIGLSDAVKVDKVLIVSDQITLVEVVYAAPVRRTKLFLVIGNLAIQLTGG